jgi:mannose-6-phosphate isomerase-like protein (cupin superfamily)
MRLRSTDITSIKKRETLFVKNFTTIFKVGNTGVTAEYDIKPTSKVSTAENEYDFNFISKYAEENSPQVLAHQPDKGFNSVWQLKCVHTNEPFFFTLLDFLRKIFKYTPDQRDGVDFFFSFCTTTGDTHTDTEDVFILGLLGKTIYRDYKTNQDYQLEKGDLLYVPKGRKHRAISLTPRVIASVGFFGGNSD